MGGTRVTVLLVKETEQGCSHPSPDYIQVQALFSVYGIQLFHLTFMINIPGGVLM